MATEKRRYPRGSVQFNVTVETSRGSWQGRAMNLSPLGIKLAVLGEPWLMPVGTPVQIKFPMRDGEASFSLPASVQRVDPDGVVLGFRSLGLNEFRRLKSLVNSDLQRDWQALLRQTEIRHSPAAGNGSRAGDDAELARWQALLDRLGLDSLHLPRDSTLSRQWREFFKRIEAELNP